MIVKPSNDIKEIEAKSKLGYSLISHEYYESFHRTCKLFDNLNSVAVLNWDLENFLNNRHIKILEVGCGKSKLVEFWRFKTKNIFLSDISIKMLQHSIQINNILANFFVSSSLEIPIKNSGIDLLFSFLSDPYNIFDFYKESYRVLSKNGIMFGTIPSFDWASGARFNYRDKTIAAFKTQSGISVKLPSLIDTIENLQNKLLSACFRRVIIDCIYIPNEIKLQEIPNTIFNIAKHKNINFRHLPILYCYKAEK